MQILGPDLRPTSLFGGGWGMIPESADSRVGSETEKERLLTKSCVVKSSPLRQLEPNSTGELQEAIKNTPQSYSIQWVKMLAAHWLKGIFVGPLHYQYHCLVQLMCQACSSGQVLWTCSNYASSTTGVLRRYGQGSAGWLQLGFPSPKPRYSRVFHPTAESMRSMCCPLTSQVIVQEQHKDPYVWIGQHLYTVLEKGRGRGTERGIFYSKNTKYLRLSNWKRLNYY